MSKSETTDRIRSWAKTSRRCGLLVLVCSAIVFIRDGSSLPPVALGTFIAGILIGWGMNRDD